MEGIDISHWTFDRHNSLFYFITNADEYIYMRYGGRDSEAAESYLSLESLELALAAGLKRHEKYKNGELSPRPRQAPSYPRDIPLLKKYVLGERGCVECHHIADYKAQQLEQHGELNKLRTMFPYPDIRTVGIHLDVPQGLVVDRASAEARFAGMESGDRIVNVNGTAVFTFADFQFEYEKIARDAESFTVVVERDNESHELTITLPPKWWYYDVDFRYWSIDPLMYFDAEPLGAEKKQELGLADDSMACEVTEVNSIGPSFGFHSLKVGDVITAVNGIKTDKTTGDAMLYLRLNLTPGDSAELTVRREDETMQMELQTKRQFYRKSLPDTKEASK